MKTSSIILALIIILVIILVVLLIHDNYILREELLALKTVNDAVVTNNVEPEIEQVDDPWFVEFNIDRRPTLEPTLEHSQELRGEQYFETNQYNNHADDSQNVHDSQVVKSVNKKYNRLLELNKDHIQSIVNVDSWRQTLIETAFREIGNYLATINLPENEMLKIQAVLDKARLGNTFESFNDTEDWIIAQIWIRINHSDNANKKDELMKAFVDQIKDAGKNAVQFGDAVVHGLAAAFGIAMRDQPRVVVDTECITGRISRYFQTFTLLDADDELASPIKDKKELENEAFAKSSQILKNILDRNPDLAELYNSVDDLNPIDAQKLETFRQTIMKSIEDEISRDYLSVIPHAELEILISKCKAGV